ncbi:MAG: NAD(P)H-binding protein [Rhodospirillales bacterium]|nr:NAD(P)H-binding protein [Rhodospirillales bacterium]MDE2198253.1 NAD(P)H-binding protein [Rhodospirillales bacterium]
MSEAIHVIGASGRSGAVLCAALAARGDRVVAVVRDGAKFRRLGLGGEVRVADLADPPALARALAGARRVVSCAHARHAAAILAAAPADARFVLLGSTRRHTRWPDGHGLGVIAGETAWLASGRSGVMLHPTMIYGAQGEDNVRRLAALLRRLPVVPLPGGGRSLVQPIHQGDLTRCVLAALDIAWDGPQLLVVAGPIPLPYADFVRAVAAAAGRRPPRILGVPVGALIALSPLTRLPGLPRIRAAELRRLTEDKAFDIAPMRARLGVAPIGLDEGLAQTFRPMLAGGPLRS